MTYPEKNISRREFLKTAAGSAAFLSWLSLPDEARAKLEEILDSRESREERFEDVIARMRNVVYEKANEEYWAHIKKHEKEYSVNIRSHATASSSSRIDLFPLFEDHDVSRIDFLHTHPAALLRTQYAVPEDKLNEIFRRKKGSYALIPSADDFLTLWGDTAKMRERGTAGDLTHSVVEPSGVWSYDADLDHPFIRNLSYPGADIDSFSEMIRNDFRLRGVLHDELRHRETRIIASGGMAKRDLSELREWGKREYGIGISYQPFA
ncbi:MAG: hypothetical protein A2934_02525 [Candidatus Sungbacteria bacterium RIFCSPLOWO2_01_FULL_47_10]|uniref:Uncharacterized protein n=1 Tax=Candidatus Sungbacteria bacterium RIFCSPLOWO2_01_FULL_47_10 TaxID=1802276 RepID=A0A1G2KZB9_9BACT|nr:MAG: hypothetical protein A2934_02525 [Candidatus Sungbacteria bacterium RIFCSPLOWO2_01_FULL_47_10]